MSSAGSGESGGTTPALSLLRVLARRWLHIVIAIAVCGVIGLIASVASSPTFEASSRIFLDMSGTSQSSVDPTSVVQTDASLATSVQAYELIGQSVQVGGSPVGADYAASHITAVPAASGYYFTITATAGSQGNAIKLAGAAGAAFQHVLANGGVGSTNTSVTQLKASRATLQSQLDAPNLSTDDQNNLTNAIEQVNAAIRDAEVTQAVAVTSIKLIETPVADGKIAPKPVTNLLIGAFIGLLLAVAVIWIRYLREPTVLDGRAAADAIGAPLIVGGSAKTTPSIDTIVSAVAAVLSPTAKVVALTAAGAGDLTSDTVAGLAASWSDDQGLVLVLDASPASDVRAVLERLPRATSAGLPSWAHEQTCLARSSGSGRGHVLYNRVSPSRASRPGGLAPILADRARDVDLVLLLTPPLADLPMTAASALQADAVVIVTSPVTRTDELATVPRDWPALSDRIVGVIHADRAGFGPPTVAAESRSERRSTPGGASARGRERDRDREDEADSTDRFARPRY